MFELQPSGTWVQAFKLVASDGTASAFFGTSVSLSDDRALVGASGAEAAYVFERQQDGAWTEVAKLLANDGAGGDEFGSSVSLTGDRALVGAPSDDDKGNDSGSAYVFERRPNGEWVEAAKILAYDGGQEDYFGFSVSLAGDRMLVGAIADDDKGRDSGSAYVFERQLDGAWVEAAKFLATDGIPFGFFGYSVSLSIGRALVGAVGDSSAYVFEQQTNGAWIEATKLLSSSGVARNWFGVSVSLLDDRALVGADLDDGKGGAYSGSAYVFERQPNGEWVEEAKLLASDGASNDLFGRSVSLSGERALVGAFFGTTGSAYLFDLLPLSSQVTQISLSSGGSQPLEIDAGHLHADELYWLLGSTRGTSPGITGPGGMVLPLNPSPYLTRTLEFPNQPPLANSLGVLNAAGHADASFTIVPFDPNLAGITLHHAFVTFSSSHMPTFVSNALPLTLVVEPEG